jgi:hypothetical protein
MGTLKEKPIGMQLNAMATPVCHNRVIKAGRLNPFITLNLQPLNSRNYLRNMTSFHKEQCKTKMTKICS